MKKLNDNSIDEIAEKLSKNMGGYNHFFEYRKNLIDIILKREPGILFNPLENTNPYTYIDNPIQIISTEEITNTWELGTSFKEILQDMASKGEEPKSPQAFCGARLGKRIDTPIAVENDPDGLFYIVDGIQRGYQAVVSGDKDILAFVDKGDGPTLEEVFNKVKGISKQ